MLLMILHPSSTVKIEPLVMRTIICRYILESCPKEHFSFFVGLSCVQHTHTYTLSHTHTISVTQTHTHIMTNVTVYVPT